MARYRIGNDMTILWTVNGRDGSALPLKDKEVHLYYTCERGRFEADFEIQGTNVVAWNFLGKNQRALGDYTLSLEILQSNGKRTIKMDKCNAFSLVGRNCEEVYDDGDADINEGGELAIVSNLDIYRISPIIPQIGENSNWHVDGKDTGKPSTGMSAFQYAQTKGFEGTEEEFAINMAETANVSGRIQSIEGIKDAISYYEEQEDIATNNTQNGYWIVTSDGQDASPAIHGVGASGIATKKWDGSWRSFEYPVKAGERYVISGACGGDGRLFLVLDSARVIVQESQANLSGTEYLTIEKDGILYCSFLPALGNYSAYKQIGESEALKNIEEKLEEIQSDSKDLSVRTASIEDYLGYEEKEQDLGELMLNGYWKMSSYEVGTKAIPEKVWDGGWRSIEYSVKAGEKYRITGLGGVGGRIYTLLDSTGYIQAVAEASASVNDYILSVGKNGTLYCSFAKEVAYSLVQISNVFTNNIGGGIDYKKGSFDFGKTCNLDYTCPEIDVWSWPESGQRVNTINGYYDELMAEFPQYISRVNCDEVMASLGITKPTAIQNAPMYLYKFLPPRTPEGSQVTTSVVNRIKVFVVTGTHPEFTAVWDMINTMRLVCRSWRDDKNLDELRWNADIYIIPCLNQYGLDNSQRTNENGVDINRNAPTADWVYQGAGTQTFSGAEPGSEYSTKVYMHFLDEIKPDVFIDHHATNVGSGNDEGDGKNMIYVHSTDKLAIDVGGVLISQMTRKWRDRYADTFPSVEEDPVTIFGFSTEDTVPGSLSKYASEKGSLGSTYESNFGILYKNKQYGTQYRQTNTVLVNTCATEGWINYLVRLLRAYSEMVGIK